MDCSLLPPMVSSSSMKMMAGELALAVENSFLTFCAPTPTNLDKGRRQTEESQSVVSNELAKAGLD